MPVFCISIPMKLISDDPTYLLKVMIRTQTLMPGLGSIPELELELMPIPIPIPGIGIAKELNKRNWNWNWN